MKSLFEYKDYKAYLQALIRSKPRGGRGIKLALANAISCPVSRISQVLAGDAHFSLEQAEGINEFFAHTAEEATHFLLLVQSAKAGTPALRRRLEEQLQAALQKRQDLKERFGLKSEMTHEDQSRFYSSWLYGAIHVLLSIPEFQTRDAIATRLAIPQRQVSEILEFLCSIGLAETSENGRYQIGKSRIHLERDSPMISKFHTNWRMQAVRSLDRHDAQDDLHYSAAVTISHADRARIRSLLLRTIDEINVVIRDSPEEGAHCLTLDFFKI